MQSSKNRAWLTPNTEDALAEKICRRFFVPDSDAFRESVSGALLELTHSWNWEQYGTMMPEDTAIVMLEMYNQYALENACPVNVPTPYWDDSEDVDDEMPEGEQIWYGSVSDPEASPDELTFIENAIIWAFTGFLAIGLGDLNVAIAFRTIAPRFVLAMRSDDFVEVIRIIVDGQEAARKTTSGTAGDITEVPIVTDASLDYHDIMIIKVS